MTLSVYQASIVNDAGDILPGAEVEVILESTGLPATIYSTRGGAALSNPMFADANGFAQFYADAGEYRISATSGVFSQVWRYVRLGDGGSNDTGTNFDQIPLNSDIVYPVESVQNLAGLVGTQDDQQLSLKGWHPDSDVGGGKLYWDAAKLKSEHNGGTVFSPTVPFSATTIDYLNGVGETDGAGSGCWVRVDVKSLCLSMFGVIGNEVSVVSMITIVTNLARGIFLPVIFDVPLTVSSSIIIGGEHQDIRILEDITTTSEDPILEIKCARSKISGISMSTTLYSPYSPNGIIHIDDDFTDAISYNDIGNFNLESTLQPSGSGSKGLHMESLDGYIKFVYYNNLHDLKFTFCDTAAYLKGNINANFFSNIFMVGCGNNKTFSDSAGFYMVEGTTIDNTSGGTTRQEGPLENQISNVFHTGSNNATSLFFDGKIYNNKISWSCETGGATATSFKTVNSVNAYGNIVVMTAIAFGGPDIDPIYYANNSFNDGGNSRIAKVTSPNIKATADIKLGETTGASIAIPGLFVGTTGENHLTKDSSKLLLMNVLSGALNDRWFDFRVDGAFAGQVGVNNGTSDRINFTGRTRGLQLEDTVVHPCTTSGAVADNLVSLGKAASRWSEVFAVNGTINTSDAREKTEVTALTDDEIEASIQLSKEVGGYKWLASVASKGDNARYHIGMTVQRAIEIMKSNNLEPMSYGFICYDEWDAVEATYNKEGVLAGEAAEAGSRYGFRYEQLVMFILSGMENRLSRAGI